MLQRDNEMRVCVLVSLLFISMLFVTCSSAVPIHAASSWSIQTVDKNASDSGVIALDSNNNPHIAYDQTEAGKFSNTNNVMYASWNGSGWSTQTLMQQAALDSFLLDSNNSPHVLYVNETGEESLMYASWTGSSWSTQTIDNSGPYGSLELDSQGNPDIAYTENNWVLMYAAWTGSSWTTQTVDSSEKVINSALSLALDSNNTPPILYAQSPNSNGINNPTAVRYAELSGSGWNIQSILPNINMGSLGNMVLDSDDYPHFTYCANETLNYDSWNGSAWNSQTVASTYYSNFSAYLALDSHNYPHIVYYNEANDSFIGALMYASWTGKAWSIQTIDANNATGAGDIVLDPNGNPHISYPAQPPNAGQPSSIKYLNYATITEPTPTSTATPAPTNEFALLIIVPVFTVIVLATLAYIWKKKTRK